MLMRSGGNGNGVEKGALKKGPWTKTEDEILMEYVRRHGEGNWNAVQKNSGLSRCGKSCRLRWANHLRPNLKKGSFSPEEELLILRLHAQLGNKWARMAAHLPGRTDNEIKNYWNTRIKKRLKAGLPLYPPDIQPLDSPAATPPSTPSTNSVPRYAIPGLIQFPSPPQLSAAPLFSHHPFLSPPPTPTPEPSPALHLNRHGNAGQGYQLPPLPCQFILPTVPDAAAALFRYGLCSNNHELGSPVGHPLPDPMSPAPFSVKMELPSCQPFPEPLCTGGGVGVQSGGNSGLLDALLQDSQGVTTPPVDAPPPSKFPASVNHISNNPEMILWSSPAATATPLVLDSVCKWEDPNDSSIAIGRNEEPVCMVDPSREDVLTLLDMIPTAPMSSLNSLTPEWYGSNSGEASSEQLLEDARAGDGIGGEIVQMVKSEEHDGSSGLCPWSNMPGIC